MSNKIKLQMRYEALALREDHWKQIDFALSEMTSRERSGCMGMFMYNAMVDYMKKTCKHTDKLISAKESTKYFDNNYEIEGI